MNLYLIVSTFFYTFEFFPQGFIHARDLLFIFKVKVKLAYYTVIYLIMGRGEHQNKNSSLHTLHDLQHICSLRLNLFIFS